MTPHLPSSLLVLILAASSVMAQNAAIAIEASEGMVLIPAGSYQMGKDEEEGGDHSPAHIVQLDAFYLDQTEVTNAQYLAFCEATGHDLPFFWGMERFRSGPTYPDHPVVGISSRSAMEYAEWCGKRLPTEAEWEYAARGGVEGKNFPNTDEIDSTLALYRRPGVDGPVPVGTFPPNGFGLYDMAGNVGEWVSDFYAADFYPHSPSENPAGPEQGPFRCIRGGGWFAGPSCNRVYARLALPVNWVDFNLGFRCAKDVQSD